MDGTERKVAVVIRVMEGGDIEVDRPVEPVTVDGGITLPKTVSTPGAIWPHRWPARIMTAYTEDEVAEIVAAAHGLMESGGTIEVTPAPPPVDHRDERLALAKAAYQHRIHSRCDDGRLGVLIPDEHNKALYNALYDVHVPSEVWLMAKVRDIVTREAGTAPVDPLDAGDAWAAVVGLVRSYPQPVDPGYPQRDEPGLPDGAVG